MRGNIVGTLATMFISLGKSLDLTLEVDMQDTRKCSILSEAAHREHVGLMPGCVRESLAFMM